MRPSAVQADSVIAEYKKHLMKRGLVIILSVLTVMVAAVSCGSARHASADPLSDSALDGYAGDYFFREGVRLYNEGQMDAAMDLMFRSLDYDTASAATCYCLTHNRLNPVHPSADSIQNAGT